MRILGLTQRESGCGWHRVVMPLGFMPGIKATVTNIPTVEILQKGFDIILYNRFSIWDNNIEEIKKDYKVVVDMDDDWVLPPSHILSIGYEKFQSRIESNLRNADLVTCTNERLYNRIKPFNPNTIVLPNAIPYGQHQYTAFKEDSLAVRIFWAGSVTHQRDLAMLRGPLQKLKSYGPKIKMVLGGYTDTDITSKTIWQRMFSSFTAGGRLPWMRMSGTTPNEYMRHFEHADIMLVPLEQSDWHACKSNLKLLEAAAKKIPVICSKVEPYSLDTDAPVLWVEKQSDWYKHLKTLINEPQTRQAYGEALYQWARTKYNFDAINEQRKEAFARLLESN